MMENFERILSETTAKGSNNVPGAVVAVVDREGTFLYKNVGGYNGVSPEAKALEFDQSFEGASCTKLITSIAVLQTIERGLIDLDQPVNELIPELASQAVIEAHGDSEFELHQATKPITLRHLLSHSSGAVYDFTDPTLQLWRKSRGETGGFSLTGLVTHDYAMPRLFEVGEGWKYGTGLDWAGLIVARLNKTTLEKYVAENISKPLGITTFTWHLRSNPTVAEKLMPMSSRESDGNFVASKTPFTPDPVEGAGGGGLHFNVHDYTRVLADLLRPEPVLLKTSSVEQLFKPQYHTESPALKDFYANSENTWRIMVGGTVEGVVAGPGLAGAVMLEDVDREGFLKPKDTLTWSGLPHVVWNVNRRLGLATLFATQVVPYGDAKTIKLSSDFETAAWRHFAKETRDGQY